MKRYLLSFLALLLPITALAIHIKSPAAKLDIDTNKVAYLSGTVSDAMYESVLVQTSLTGALPGDRLWVFDSHGGEQAPGDGIIELMEAEKAKKIRQICVVYKQAQSMAFNILVHCDVRLAVRDAVIMAHVLALASIDCMYTRCTPRRLKALADELLRDDAPYRKANAAALSCSLKEYDGYAARDYDWPVEELLRRHFLSAIVRVVK